MSTRFLLISFTCMWLCSSLEATAQEQIPDRKSTEQNMEGWFGIYTKYRVKDRLYYYGEYHLRGRDYVRSMAQIYLRFGMTYLITKGIEVTGGFVSPIYWARNMDQENIDRVLPQFRFWEQVVFVQPFSRFKIYHQLRFEQRWRRDHQKGSPIEMTFRFRYKITAYVPLNRQKLVNRTLFLSMYEEIFIQAGKPVVYNHFEDNRMFLGLGYIINENFQIQAGYMWTYRHMGSPFKYESRHIPRLSIYHTLDFHGQREKRKEKQRKKILNNEF